MKSFIFYMLSILALFALITPTHAEDTGTLRAAVVAADISPPVGVPLAGYGGGKRRLFPPDLDPDNYNVLLAASEGVMHPLITKVVVLESNGTKIAIIKLDSVGVMQKMVVDLAKRIEPITGIGVDHITATGTHTHAGPGAMTTSPFWAVAAVDLFDNRVYQPFIDKLANLVIEADKNLQPARMGVSTGMSFNLSRNRRKHPGVFDPTVAVFKIEHLDGTPMAIMFNFAIHGTCLGASNLQMSGDVMGYAEREIEAKMAARKTPAVALFVNGAEGDVSPKQGKAKGAKIVGNSLGKKVLSIVPSIATRADMDIAVANEVISFEKAHLNLDLSNDRSEGAEIDYSEMRSFLQKMYPKKKINSKLKVEVTGLVEMSYRLQAIRFGDTVIACIPGEPLTQIGMDLKAVGSQMGFSNTFIFGLANGHMGYVCDLANFEEGGYEAMLNLFGGSQGEAIVNKFAGLFQKLAKK